MKTLTLNTLNKEIVISVEIDEIVNLDNAEKNDANVTVAINDKELVGQVQFAPEWGEYTTQYSGNEFYSEIQDALLSQYPQDLLHDEAGMATDERLELTEDIMPQIEQFICTFVAENA